MSPPKLQPPLPAPPGRKRYAIVGLGGRSRMFSEAILSTYREHAELVGLCDINQRRMDYHNALFAGRHRLARPVPTYKADGFERMIAQQKPATVIVTSIDRTHARYIIGALERGCDVISEKPMTIDAASCRAILDATARTGRNVRVSFNYRYAPARTRVKELLMQKTIGEVKAVHFEWLLDTRHGADYFRRWHRDKRNSGGLMVHKATHHFDLVNWWLESAPEVVFGFGALAFYGRANAEARGESHPYVRGTDDPRARSDPFALDLRDGATLQKLYYEAEEEDGYRRDQNVFGDGISIEDTMNLVVRYKSGVQLSYTLTAYAPWEGCRIAFTGTRGRIEFEEMEQSCVNAGGGIGEGFSESYRITVLPHWEKPYEVEAPPAPGGHGGGDPPLLGALFSPTPPPDPFDRAAGALDGAHSILTGIAANHSFATGLPVRVDDLLRG